MKIVEYPMFNLQLVAGLVTVKSLAITSPTHSRPSVVIKYDSIGDCQLGNQPTSKEGKSEGRQMVTLIGRKKGWRKAAELRELLSARE